MKCRKIIIGGVRLQPTLSPSCLVVAVVVVVIVVVVDDDDDNDRLFLINIITWHRFCC